jgi:hypothetical protein
MKKQHIWSASDDERLKIAVDECKPIFEHFEQQNKSYTQLNAWDAVAGRLLPEVCVTGAACKRRWEVLKEQKESKWSSAIEMVERYERELAETTFDGVSELLESMDALHEKIKRVEAAVLRLERIWE